MILDFSNVPLKFPYCQFVKLINRIIDSTGRVIFAIDRYMMYKIQSSLKCKHHITMQVYNTTCTILPTLVKDKF